MIISWVEILRKEKEMKNFHLVDQEKEVFYMLSPLYGDMLALAVGRGIVSSKAGHAR